MTGTGSNYPRIYLHFQGDTAELLHTAQDPQEVLYPLTRRASIKDIIEGLGVPHTEVGRILLDGQDHSFEKIPCDGEHYRVESLSPEAPPTVPTFLRPQPLPACVFLVDINVGRLARLLRMAGIDAESVEAGTGGDELLQRAAGEHRILLTRNRELLKYRRLVFGRLVRSQQPEAQLAEILRLYRLQEDLRPFSRCIACNGLLATVDKAAILDRLLPLTRKYFDRFKECPGCGQIYWHGSHHQKMREKLERILGRA